MPQATRYRRRRKEKLLGRAKSCRWQVFVRRRPPKGCRWGRRKDLIGLARSRHCGELNRGLQNLGASFGKGFNCYGAKMSLRWADSRFAKPRNFLRKGRFSYFSLVRKEPKVHQRFTNLWTPGTIQSSAGSNFAKFSGGFCRNRFCLQTAGVKALNRCERIAIVLTQDR